MFSRSKYGIFFTVVYIYIIISFIWWWWLLHHNNRSNYTDVLNRERITYLSYGHTEAEFYTSAYYNELNHDYRQKTAMLIGEGLIFITLISAGFLRIRSTVRDEISLTRQQNNFLLSITHELKSPLASMKLSMQTLQKHALDQDRVRRLADISLSDVDRLESLVENILLASKMDTNGFKINKEPFNLSETANRIFGRIQQKYGEERGFQCAVEEDIYILGDHLIFTSVVYNLLENAVKYSREGDQINMELSGDDKRVTLSISDTGIGIDDKEKQKVFQRFYRVGREETRTTKGTGLGLFIVKQSVLFHDGNIQVKDNPGGGTLFIITLPRPV